MHRRRVTRLNQVRVYRLSSVVYPRCLVREGLLQFIQEHYPETLPRVRAEVLTRDGACPPETVAAMGR